MANDVDQHTAQIVPDAKTSVTGQYFDLNQPFAFPRYGNECESYINGSAYMKAVAEAIRGANSFIMITGWQLDYDVELDQRGTAGHPGRLSELLTDAMARGVHVRVMLYDSLSMALDTHDDTTQTKLESLPEGRGSIKVMLQNPNTGRNSLAYEILTKKTTGRAMNPNINFSHHQKSVIVDGNIAFVGGIDLAYGRWDTNNHAVTIDRKLHVLNDAYNGQITPARHPTAAEIALTKEKNGRLGFAPAYTTNGNDDGLTLDERYQARQPWQDIAMRIKGPAVFDVFANFVLRWGSFAGSGTNVADANMNKVWFETIKGQITLANPLAREAGTANVQICRSASSAQLGDEIQLWNNNHYYVNDDWKSPNSQRRTIVQQARKEWQSNHQTSIRDAMINSIRSAQAFIYIENQFFMSDCGTDQNGTKPPSTNRIIHELANAVAKAVNAERAFHIWLVLPEHPEGMMEGEATATQTWWALQSVKRAKDSLINRINRAIEKKNKSVKPDEWKKYLTVLNTRNYGRPSNAVAVLSEMIYVHSKLTIVDDAVAIIGSANINDRSLNGNGDTELAAVVVDDANAQMTDVGGGVRCVTRKFARDLREKLWQKHLGMMINGGDGAKQQTGTNGVSISRPLEPASIKALQTLADNNRAAYSEVFVHTARDSFGKLRDGRIAGYTTIYKDRNYKDKELFSPKLTPPLQPAYMNGKVHKAEDAIKKLDAQVKGFWVAMPLEWGSNESSTPRPPQGMPALIAERKPSQPKTDTSMVV